MDKVKFLNHIPANLSDEESNIYQSKTYLKLLDGKVQSYSAIENDSKKLVLSIHFQIINNQAFSLAQAPFGNLNIFDDDLNEETLLSFIQFVIKQLNILGLSQIIIKSAPPFYDHASCIKEKLLIEKFNFDCVQTDINHHIYVNELPLVGQMSSMQKRRLKKCVAADFSFNQKDFSSLKEVYRFILKCRVDKSHSLSISLNQLESTAQALPNNYLIFCCYDKEELIAASICVLVNTDTIYNFLPASNKDYNEYSPMVYLISKLYEYCQLNGIKILDLGTSMLKNKPNESLIKFKERMGGIKTERNVYALKPKTFLKD